ncbi:hypothetical protein Q0590_02235 [Rhodocytophaga aerolata]|uniref:IrrE N-terminal-like domain-containing protein n=1 Tax=Rhodocytophaga aerolata TaxID=455078 RepID=A0ABT8R2P3_9BACT|nr:hypothetical protein [Rhodocytophaga aerolata]MDO1445047.1 hypothetical protein [Rhodocytophaga aerolata]
MQAGINNYSPGIPPQIKPHLTEFIAQAKQRGIVLDTTRLVITFVDYLQDREGNAVNGKYIRQYLPFRQDIIQLDTTAYWWSNLYAREKVIFHELGHCLLRREHRFDTFPGNLPKSIMGVTKIPTYELTPLYRTYYMNELFNPETPAPCWTEKFGCVN